MNEIDRLFEKYAKPMDIGYENWVKILVKSDFRQAMTEYERTLKRKIFTNVITYMRDDEFFSRRELKRIINNTKLEEQK